jgi:hypothetical protein
METKGSWSQNSVTCLICRGRVDENELFTFKGERYHSHCAKCSICNCELTLQNAFRANSMLFCSAHFANGHSGFGMTRSDYLFLTLSERSHHRVFGPIDYFDLYVHTWADFEQISYELQTFPQFMAEKMIGALRQLLVTQDDLVQAITFCRFTNIDPGTNITVRNGIFANVHEKSPLNNPIQTLLTRLMIALLSDHNMTLFWHIIRTGPGIERVLQEIPSEWYDIFLSALHDTVPLRLSPYLPPTRAMIHKERLYDFASIVTYEPQVFLSILKINSIPAFKFISFILSSSPHYIYLRRFTLAQIIIIYHQLNGEHQLKHRLLTIAIKQRSVCDLMALISTATISDLFDLYSLCPAIFCEVFCPLVSDSNISLLLAQKIQSSVDFDRTIIMFIRCVSIADCVPMNPCVLFLQSPYEEYMLSPSGHHRCAVQSLLSPVQRDDSVHHFDKFIHTKPNDVALFR